MNDGRAADPLPNPLPGRERGPESITADEARAFPPLAGYAARPEVVMMVVGPAEAPRVAGVLDPQGGPTAPGVPAIRVVHVSPGASLDDEVTPLIRALVDAAARLDPTPPGGRVLIGWDPMDVAGLRRLQSLGFVPTGSMPYFERGPGHVEYVTGYMDPVGSVLDLACAL